MAAWLGRRKGGRATYARKGSVRCHIYEKNAGRGCLSTQRLSKAPAAPPMAQCGEGRAPAAMALCVISSACLTCFLCGLNRQRKRRTPSRTKRHGVRPAFIWWYKRNRSGHGAWSRRYFAPCHAMHPNEAKDRCLAPSPKNRFAWHCFSSWRGKRDGRRRLPIQSPYSLGQRLTGQAVRRKLLHRLHIKTSAFLRRFLSRQAMSQRALSHAGLQATAFLRLPLSRQAMNQRASSHANPKITVFFDPTFFS